MAGTAAASFKSASIEERLVPWKEPGVSLAAGPAANTGWAPAVAAEKARSANERQIFINREDIANELSFKATTERGRDNEEIKLGKILIDDGVISVPAFGLFSLKEGLNRFERLHYQTKRKTCGVSWLRVRGGT
ncbi:hypothetical protein ACD591_03085 [Rufibacter glacialis]|uniref:Uncharacterized protein n=1 Tax=Rufibacter glacialis TaxID=1259555 RepID=A0ABV4RAX6_9BACT|nr:hypothetical protein [Rufibacter glacialis]